jgi:hypothetical protein
MAVTSSTRPPPFLEHVVSMCRCSDLVYDQVSSVSHLAFYKVFVLLERLYFIAWRIRCKLRVKRTGLTEFGQGVVVNAWAPQW